MPEVEVVGMVLYFGSPDATDGGGDQLQMTHVSASGFWGKWATDLGIAVVMDTTTGKALADPAGWFCSYRRTSWGGDGGAYQANGAAEGGCWCGRYRAI